MKDKGNERNERERERQREREGERQRERERERQRERETSFPACGFYPESRLYEMMTSLSSVKPHSTGWTLIFMLSTTHLN